MRAGEEIESESDCNGIELVWGIVMHARTVPTDNGARGEKIERYTKVFVPIGSIKGER